MVVVHRFDCTYNTECDIYEFVFVLAGYFHSGYPVMGLIDPEAVNHINTTQLKKQGSWGLAHEIGHNVQWLTGFQHNEYSETTNNFWSIFINQKVINSFHI